MKLGSMPFHFKAHSIWFHAVSVGELNALMPLLTLFEGVNIVLSTSTQTAQDMAAKKLAKKIKNREITLIYMPYDHPFIVSKVLDQISPSALVLMETEIWPALISASRDRNIPVVVLNARLADKSFNSYKSFQIFFRWVFSQISLVLAQSPNDCRKFLELGVDKKRLYMTGNIKFAAYRSIDKSRSELLRSELGYKADDQIFIAASTHPGEEAYILSIFHELKVDFPKLKIIIAPRHPERFTIVEDIIQSAAQLETVRFSKIKPQLTEFKTKTLNGDDECRIVSDQNDILLVDTIGDLAKLFSISTISFVGGTVIDDVGGHNVLEPAAYGVPVLIGPNYFKNRETVAMMENEGALIVGETLQDLKFALKRILADKDELTLMGAKALNLVDKNKEVVVNTANKLKEFLSNEHRLKTH